MIKNYVIGVDFGTDSVRSVLVDTADGNVMATSVFNYPRWKIGLHCDPSQSRFRQHPSDHLEGLVYTVKSILQESGIPRAKIKGIGVDTTGSSPLPIDRKGVPLAFKKEFENNPNAQVILWKDHTSIREAEEITRLSKTWAGVDYTSYSGGIYSSEWFWAKILNLYRIDPELESAEPNWVEHCDFISGELTGNLAFYQIKRSRCAAGHKAMWHESWGGFPSDNFLNKLRPSLIKVKEKLSNQTYTSVESVGRLSSTWASLLGLSTETLVSVGTVDAHAGAAGAGIQPGTLVKVMGTSTCDLLVSPKKYNSLINQQPIKGISGQVDGSIVPGMIGFEAGQAGFGDFLAWFKNLIIEPSIQLINESKSITSCEKTNLIEDLSDRIWSYLSQEAEKHQSKSEIISMDWINGRRSPDVNESLKAAITGIGMGTSAGEIYNSLVHALCFGSKRIIDRFEENGVIISKVMGVGGIAKKSPFLVQTMADVLGKPITIVDSDQTPALGSAIYAAVASEVYKDYHSAVAKMSGNAGTVYYPRESNIKKIEKNYSEYLSLGNLIENES